MIWFHLVSKIPVLKWNKLKDFMIAMAHVRTWPDMVRHIEWNPIEWKDKLLKAMWNNDMEHIHA